MRSILVGVALLAFGMIAKAQQTSDGVISRVPIEGTDYCRLRFPAIREDTLFTSRPQLKDPRDGDVVVLYGRCDYDPLGIDEIRRQRAEARRDRRNDNR